MPGSAAGDKPALSPPPPAARLSGVTLLAVAGALLLTAWLALGSPALEPLHQPPVGGQRSTLLPPRMPGGAAHGPGSNSQGPPHGPPQRYTPFSLPLAERRFAYEAARLEVPTLVSRLRRLLTVQLALAVLLGGVEGDFVETGVYTGGTSILMLKTLERYDRDWLADAYLGTDGTADTGGGSSSGGGGGGLPGRRLWAADSFQGTPAPVEQDQGGAGALRTGFKGEYAAPLEKFRANLAAWNVSHHLASGRLRILEGWFNETLAPAPIQRISFLRLDGDLYVSTRDALEALYDRLAPGGFVYVDDYGSYTGCQRAVHEFRERRGITSPLQIQSVPEQVMFGRPAEETVWAAAWWEKEPHEPVRPPDAPGALRRL